VVELVEACQFLSQSGRFSNDRRPLTFQLRIFKLSSVLAIPLILSNCDVEDSVCICPQSGAILTVVTLGDNTYYYILIREVLYHKSEI